MTTSTTSTTTANQVVNPLYNDMGGDFGFGEDHVNRNDDGYSQAIDLTAVFGEQGVNLFGNYYTHVYVNTNGNITFDHGLSNFTPREIGADFYSPIIAPFWADVDTRNTTGQWTTPGGNSQGTNLVWWDANEDTGTFTVTWDDIGFYSMNNSQLNAFQLRMSALEGGEGNFNLEFIYEDINWTTGSASGGNSDGLGGTIARAGFSAGDGVNYFELPGSGRQADMLNLNQTPLNLSWNFVNGEVEGVQGTQGDDVIVGTENDDYIYAGNGDDFVDLSAGGNNTVNLGSGNNTLIGGSGNDTVYSSDGNNVIDGGGGFNTVIYDHARTRYEVQERTDANGNPYQVIVDTQADLSDELRNIDELVFGEPVFVDIRLTEDERHVAGDINHPLRFDFTLSEALDADLHVLTNSHAEDLADSHTTPWVIQAGATSGHVFIYPHEFGSEYTEYVHELSDYTGEQTPAFFNYQTQLVSRLEHQASEPTPDSTPEPVELNAEALLSGIRDSQNLTVSPFVERALTARLDNQIANGFDSNIALSATLLNALPQLGSNIDLLGMINLVRGIREQLQAVAEWQPLLNQYGDDVIGVVNQENLSLDSDDTLLLFNDLSEQRASYQASVHDFTQGDTLLFTGPGNFIVDEVSTPGQVDVFYGDEIMASYSWTITLHDVDADALVVQNSDTHGVVQLTGMASQRSLLDWVDEAA